MNSGLRQDVCVEAVAKIDGVNVIAMKYMVSVLSRTFSSSPRASRDLRFTDASSREALQQLGTARATYHSKSLYMIVKKTCKNRLTALTNTDSKNSHASPDIILAVLFGGSGSYMCKGDVYKELAIELFRGRQGRKKRVYGIADASTNAVGERR